MMLGLKSGISVEPTIIEVRNVCKLGTFVNGTDIQSDAGTVTDHP